MSSDVSPVGPRAAANLLPPFCAVVLPQATENVERHPIPEARPSGH